MKCLLAFLVCCVVLENAQYLGIVERYCMNPRKPKLNQCAYVHGRQIVEIYQHCASAIKDGMTELSEMDEFLCSKMDYMEYQIFQGCFYGSLMVHDRRGENLTQVADWCLKKYEPRVLYDWSDRVTLEVKIVETKSAIYR